MDAIYKCYDGTYIDLERIISIKRTDYDKIGVFFQLRKEPVELYRWKEDGSSLLSDGGNRFNPCLMDIELSNLISVWDKYKTNKLCL